MAINEEDFDEATGTMYMADTRITPEDEVTGRVGRIRVNMEELEEQFDDFVLASHFAKIDGDMAAFSFMTAIALLRDHGEVSSHDAETITALSAALYRSLKHNESIDDERGTASA